MESNQAQTVVSVEAQQALQWAEKIRSEYPAFSVGGSRFAALPSCRKQKMHDAYALQAATGNLPDGWTGNFTQDVVDGFLSELTDADFMAWFDQQERN